jgi:uncharacterized protein YabE (DUF348 family)
METLVDPADAAINGRLTKEEKISFPARDVQDQAIRADLSQVLQPGKNQTSVEKRTAFSTTIQPGMGDC